MTNHEAALRLCEMKAVVLEIRKKRKEARKFLKEANEFAEYLEGMNEGYTQAIQTIKSRINHWKE